MLFHILAMRVLYQQETPLPYCKLPKLFQVKIVFQKLL